MDPLALVAALSVLATVVVATAAFYGSTMSQSTAMRGRLQGIMSGTSVVQAPTVPGALRIDDTGPGFIGKLASGQLGEQLALQLERADLGLRPGEYVALRFVVAAAGFFGPVLYWQGTLTSFIIGAVAGVVGYNLPKFYLNRRRKSRVDKLNAQLPETLTMISNSLKAGFGLLQSLNLAAEQLEQPISSELARTIHEMNIGSSAEEALLGLSERSGSYDLDIVVTAILVQRSVGGNLGEILDTVAGTMRERIRIRGEIQTLTAQQKLTGIIIGLLPLGVAVLFQFLSPGYMSPLFTTLVGKMMIAVACVMEVVGILIIQRVLTIEV